VGKVQELENHHFMTVRFKLFNEARIDKKENEQTSKDWKGLY
jgi:hypothetical protein